MALEICCPDGQTFAVLANTTVRRGEFGLPEDVLPDRVFALEPVQGADGVVMLSVLGTHVEMLVEQSQQGQWELIEHLTHSQQAALDSTAPVRFRVTVPELPPPSVTFTVVCDGGAPRGGGGGGGGGVQGAGQGVTVEGLKELADVATSMGALHGALSSSSAPLQPQKLPDHEILRYTAALQREVTQPAIDESTWRAMGFGSQNEARAVLGDEAFYHAVPEAGQSPRNSPRSDVAEASAGDDANAHTSAFTEGPVSAAALLQRPQGATTAADVANTSSPVANGAVDTSGATQSSGAAAKRVNEGPPETALSKRHQATLSEGPSWTRAASGGGAAQSADPAAFMHRAGGASADGEPLQPALAINTPQPAATSGPAGPTTQAPGVLSALAPPLDARTAAHSTEPSAAVNPHQRGHASGPIDLSAPDEGGHMGAYRTAGGAAASVAAPRSSAAAPAATPHASAATPAVPDLEAPFALLWARYNLPAPCNHGCFGVKLRQLVCGYPRLALISNYMIDLVWFLTACPDIANAQQIVLVHGQQPEAMKHVVASIPLGFGTRVTLHKPRLEEYGTHHTKAFVLVYAAGVRVIVHTANLIFIDCNDKTQGLWFQDFPIAPPAQRGTRPCGRRTDFGATLLEYLQALRLPAQAWNALQEALESVDFSGARAALVPSTPGRHAGQTIARRGHMRVRALLNKEQFPGLFKGAPVVCQFSSIGSLTAKWLQEFQDTLCSGWAAPAASTAGRAPLGPPRDQSAGKGLHCIWPTEEDVRCSMVGWASGGALPARAANLRKPFLQQHLSRWDAGFSNHDRLMPHIKSYCRFHGPDVAWFLLGSHNLSKAAWGELQSKGASLFMRSFELSVLMLPQYEAQYRASSNRGFQCDTSGAAQLHAPRLLRCPATALHVGAADTSGDEAQQGPREPNLIRFKAALQPGGVAAEPGVTVVPLPIPYALPPPRYGAADVGWVVDDPHDALDVKGNTREQAQELHTGGWSQSLVPAYAAENN